MQRPKENIHVDSGRHVGSVCVGQRGEEERDGRKGKEDLLAALVLLAKNKKIN
jgi:hypothetical protein